MKLRRFGENRIIEWIRGGHCGARGKAADTGIGDDCAVIRSFGGKELLITTDSLVEDVHFSLSHSTPAIIGEKSVYVNLSDIAAMGGTPEAIFLNLGLPAETEKKIALQLISGIHRACGKYGVSLLGGDTFATTQKIFISITAVGTMRKGKAVLRSGARPQDVLFLTGTIGASALGLKLLQRDMQGERDDVKQGKIMSVRDMSHAKKAIGVFCRPLPHIEEGRFLSEGGYASAMIDVSDGLSTDLHNLCRESHVGAVIHLSKIPIDPSVSHYYSSRREAVKPALSGGEDYCLLAAVPKRKADILEREFEKRFSRTLFRIGEVTAAASGIRIVSEEGVMKPLPKTGYEHFRS